MVGKMGPGNGTYNVSMRDKPLLAGDICQYEAQSGRVGDLLRFTMLSFCEMTRSRAVSVVSGQQQCRHCGGRLGYSHCGGLISFLVAPGLRDFMN